MELGFISWETARERGAPSRSEGAFRELIANLKLAPEIDPVDTLHDLFLEESTNHRVWHYRIPASRLSDRWIQFMDLTEPEGTFSRYGEALIPTRNQPPESGDRLHRIVVRKPSQSGQRLHFGMWNRHNVILVQYQWQDGNTLIHSSTGQLRRMVTRHQMSPHAALHKWHNQLGTPVPSDVWQLTWIDFRSAAENTFLWQLLYRIPATQRWRLLGRPATDPETWCSRCNLQVTEDLFHCIWDCPTSRQCWEWCSSILSWVSPGTQAPIRIQPAHVLIAAALPQAWDTPDRLWKTFRAIVCWIIWKDRNCHIFGGEQSNVPRMIALSWHRLSMYVNVAWKTLLKRVRLREVTLPEACSLMADQFGEMGKIWTLHEIQVRVVPVPPHPP